MKAEPQVQERLLHLQERDTRLAQLAHRLASLPEAVQLADLRSRLRDVGDGIVDVQTRLSDLEAEQRRADLDVEQVRDRTRRDRELLDSGAINDPKQLQGLEHELGSLAKRQRDLEDVELEVMERVESAQGEMDALLADRGRLQAEEAELAAAVAALEGAIAAERVELETERRDLAASLPPDLLGLYDKVRADLDGVGAARLFRGRCEGCRLELTPTDIGRLRSASQDEVLRCEECRRILVRTAESGL